MLDSLCLFSIHGGILQFWWDGVSLLYWIILWNMQANVIYYYLMMEINTLHVGHATIRCWYKWSSIAVSSLIAPVFLLHFVGIIICSQQFWVFCCKFKRHSRQYKWKQEALTGSKAGRWHIEHSNNAADIWSTKKPTSKLQFPASTYICCPSSVTKVCILECLKPFLWSLFSGRRGSGVVLV